MDIELPTIRQSDYEALLCQRNDLHAELAALKGAAGALISDVDEYFRCADIGESRNKLAALVGEEGE